MKFDELYIMIIRLIDRRINLIYQKYGTIQLKLKFQFEA